MPEINVTRLRPHHVEAAAELCARCFTEREPLTARLGVGRTIFLPFALAVAARAVGQGLSVVIEDGRGRIRGVSFAEDLADPFVPDGAYPELVPVFRLLEGVTAAFLAGDPVAPRQVSHFWMGAVDAESAGRRLFTALAFGGMKIAEEAGFTHGFSEFTNPLTERFMAHIPLKTLAGVATASDLELEGRRPFAGLDTRIAAYLWPLRPGRSLELPRVARAAS